MSSGEPEGRGEPDPRAVLAALGITNATRITSVHGGLGTLLWRVQRGEESSALRLFSATQHETHHRERLAMEAAGGAGVPVPRVLAAGEWQGRPALLLNWCPGRMLSEELMQRPWRVWSLGMAFGRTQAAIHRVAAPAALATRPAAWLDWAGPVPPLLRERLLAVSPSDSCLLHLDYHPLNVLTDGRQVTAVLDWANARAGDPRADIARTLTLLRLAPLRGRLPRTVVVAFRRLLEAGWRRGYRQYAGPLDDLAPFYAWAGGVMLRDLGPKAERAGLTPAGVAAIERWIAIWSRRAGLPG